MNNENVNKAIKYISQAEEIFKKEESFNYSDIMSLLESAKDALLYNIKI